MLLPRIPFFEHSQATFSTCRVALASLLAAGLWGCGSPSGQAEQGGPAATATLPATPAGRDSARATLTTPAADAAATRQTTDTAAAHPATPKPQDKPKSVVQPKLTAQPLAASAEPATPVAATQAAPAEAVAATPATPASRTQAGRVLDEEGHPLAGATVMLKGSSKVTSTDANGNYSLEVPGGEDTFVFGYGGYNDEEATTRDGQPLTVTLAPNPNSKVRSRKRR